MERQEPVSLATVLMSNGILEEKTYLFNQSSQKLSLHLGFSEVSLGSNTVTTHSGEWIRRNQHFSATADNLLVNARQVTLSPNFKGDQREK
jgi:hypothetical protein